MKNWKRYILSCLWGPLLILQFILVFAFGKYNEAGYDAVLYAGWMIWLISAILGWIPMVVLKRKGGVEKGKSYVNTTVLVDSGIYSIMRHPQYTAGLLLSLALILISQNLMVACMGMAVIILLYVDIIIADKYAIEKFGDEYISYMKKVPRINFMLGILRLIRKS
ncbi:Protein-S-isoprenylcysteine O-methyltransferase Ste14 [Dethiosulfatibacter aminovorans DSM 17477]|uniref:Protein-S-isoprenylcysteine O-methyltransferase Ste14 n=1 Tax=Dethiosulfatibacter aminovorans DSM 17477 TaxID=1121476 RepID=A0A1M6C5A9_9FIRM|nr:isoprenylcysteine carboxylmethyltransferase family protein [Dethiosulfatibacter aminovorans]SHI56206.1 Protein-S-isoprenylcysteine O-methyltransferase Ste14 [Dethiosulfatibacter aminovorans DSM 17477]